MTDDWLEAGRLLHELLGTEIVAVHLPAAGTQHKQWITVNHGAEKLWMMQTTDLWPSAEQVALHPTPFIDRGASEDLVAQVWAADTATTAELHMHWECWLLPDPV